MNATVQTLRDARALIADEAHWTKRTLARDAEGLAVASRDAKACQWCAVGALAHVGGEAWFTSSRALIEAIPAGTSTTFFNDLPETKHADVLALFDRAIAAQEALA